MQADGEPADVFRMEAVHVLLGVDQAQAAVGVKAGGQGKLEQQAVDVVAFAQLADEVFELALGDVSFRAPDPGDDADLGAVLFLVADINLGARVVADQDHGQMGRPAVFPTQGVHVLLDLLADFGRDFFPVDQ